LRSFRRRLGHEMLLVAQTIVALGASQEPVGRSSIAGGMLQLSGLPRTTEKKRVPLGGRPRAGPRGPRGPIAVPFANDLSAGDGWPLRCDTSDARQLGGRQAVRRPRESSRLRGRESHSRVATRFDRRRAQAARLACSGASFGAQIALRTEGSSSRAPRATRQRPRGRHRRLSSYAGQP
jgi:hypothetical protein